MIRRNPLPWFFLLAFLISWAGMVPLTLYGRGLLSFTSPLFNIIGGLGPAFAAMIIVMALKGGEGLKELFRPFLLGRVGIQWYLVAFFGMAVLAGAALVLLFRFNGVIPDWMRFGPWFMVLPVFLVNLLSNVWEEIAWRGFALPRLQARFSALAASLILGILWAVWHFPLLLNPKNPMSGYPWHMMVINISAMSIIYAWLYNNTRGSLLLATLFHAASNTVAFILVAALSSEAFALHYQYLTWVIVDAAIVIALAYGANSLSRQADAPVIIRD